LTSRSVPDAYTAILQWRDKLVCHTIPIEQYSGTCSFMV
jgi:hypothetical protein